MKEKMPEGFTDADLQEFCEEIVECLVKYGKLPETEARRRLEESGLCSEKMNETLLDRQMFFHEFPYYWAMEILYAKENPDWANDPALNAWPPPPDYMAGFRSPEEYFAQLEEKAKREKDQELSW